MKFCYHAGVSFGTISAKTALVALLIVIAVLGIFAAAFGWMPIRSLLLAAVGGTPPSGYDTLVTVSTSEDLNALWDQAVAEAKAGKRVLVQLAPGTHRITRPLLMSAGGATPAQRGHLALAGASDGSSVVTGAMLLQGAQPVAIMGRSDIYRIQNYNGPVVNALSFGLARGQRARFPNANADTSAYPRVISFDSKNSRDFFIDFPLQNNSRILYPDDLPRDDIDIIIPLDGDLAQMRVQSVRDAGNGYVVTPKEPEREIFFYTAFEPVDQAPIYKTGAYAEPGATHGLFVEKGERAHSYWLENSIRFLDQPGEWAYVPSSKEIYFIPPAGFNPSTDPIWASGPLDALLSVSGDASPQFPSLAIERVTFFMTNYLERLQRATYTTDPAQVADMAARPSAYAYPGPAQTGRIGRFSGRAHALIVNPDTGKKQSVQAYEDPAAVYIFNASDVTIKDSRFLGLSAGALRFGGRSSNLIVRGNLFQDVSSFGAMFWNDSQSLIDYSVMSNVEIEDNRFLRVGAQYTGVPIRVIEKDHSNVFIHHNEIIETPYYGISISTGQNTRMFANKIIRPMMMQTDGGALWITNAPYRSNSTSDSAEINNNYIEGIAKPGFINRATGFTVSSGIYVDGGYKTSVHHNFIRTAPIGIYYLCPHEGFYLVTNYLNLTTTHEHYYKPCPGSDPNDPFNVPRPLPIVEPTASTLNNVHVEDPAQYAVQSGAGVRAAVVSRWSAYGWFGPVPATYALSGVVWVDTDADGVVDSGEAKLSGRTVTLTSPDGATTYRTVTTDANGGYSFSGLNPGTYRVTHAVPSGYTRVTDDSYVINLQANGTVNFGVKQTAYTLSGVVWVDTDADGIVDSGEATIAGRPVRLSGGSTVVTTTTDAFGRYSFGGLSSGSYRVSHDIPAGYIRTTDENTPISIQSANAIWNFGIKPQ